MKNKIAIVKVLQLIGFDDDIPKLISFLELEIDNELKRHIVRTIAKISPSGLKNISILLQNEQYPLDQIIKQIEALGNEKIDSHSGWQAQIKKMEAYREAFFHAGKVPADVTEDTWARFKNVVRAFNANKNVFYKDIKHEQHENLTKKLALVEQAKSLQESTDFNVATPIM